MWYVLVTSANDAQFVGPFSTSIAARTWADCEIAAGEGHDYLVMTEAEMWHNILVYGPLNLAS